MGGGVALILHFLVEFERSGISGLPFDEMRKHSFLLPPINQREPPYTRRGIPQVCVNNA